MKILQLCLSGGTGGLELYHVKLAKWLHERGGDHCAVVSSGSFIAGRLDKAGVQYTTLRRSSATFPLIAARRLASLMQELNVDLIHIHCRRDLALAALAKRFSRRPVRLIYTRQMGINRPKRDIYHRLLYSQVDRFLTITDYMREEALRFLPLPPGRIETLYYGVPEGRKATAATCGELFAGSGGFKIGIFGRITHGKGQHVLVEAMRMLVERGRNVEVVLVGNIVEDDYFRSLMDEAERCKIAGRVRHFGFHPDPVEIMGCFDVIVMPSKKEAFGLVLAEAMRSGVAVIGSDTCGVPEMIDDGKTGLLVRPHDAADLAQAIEKLVDDPDLRSRLAAGGKAKADSLFSEERHFSELERVYESVMAGR